MDWDGIGTMALFMSSGIVGIGLIMLGAYGLKLKHRLEQDKLAQGQQHESELTDTLLVLQEQMGRLNDRMDFNERLLEKGDRSKEGAESSGG